jgi:hypothetical protein
VQANPRRSVVVKRASAGRQTWSSKWLLIGLKNQLGSRFVFSRTFLFRFFVFSKACLLFPCILIHAPYPAWAVCLLLSRQQKRNGFEIARVVCLGAQEWGLTWHQYEWDSEGDECGEDNTYMLVRIEESGST